MATFMVNSTRPRIQAMSLPVILAVRLRNAQRIPRPKEMNYCTYFLFATRQNFGEDDRANAATPPLRHLITMPRPCQAVPVGAKKRRFTTTNGPNASNVVVPVHASKSHVTTSLRHFATPSVNLIGDKTCLLTTLLSHTIRGTWINETRPAFFPRGSTRPDPLSFSLSFCRDRRRPPSRNAFPL